MGRVYISPHDAGMMLSFGTMGPRVALAPRWMTFGRNFTRRCVSLWMFGLCAAQRETLLKDGLPGTQAGM